MTPQGFVVVAGLQVKWGPPMASARKPLTAPLDCEKKEFGEKEECKKGKSNGLTPAGKGH